MAGREDSIIAGTKQGGVQAGKTNRERYGDDWYKRIGRAGGLASRGGGFVGEEGRDRARTAGAVGGAISRRGPSEPRTRRLSDDTPESEKTCTFCTKQGHSAYTCPVRANVRKRKQFVLARQAYVAEEHQEQRNKLSELARKWKR